jgi:predicted DNA-binding protein YlxM (UPF0122 family)
VLFYTGNRPPRCIFSKKKTILEALSMLEIDVLYIQMGLKKDLFLKEIDEKRPFSQRKSPILDALSKVETGLFNLEMSLKKHHFAKKTPIR